MNDPFTINILGKQGVSQTITFHNSKPADIKTSLYYDDTIKIIKYKILDGFYKKNLEHISYESLYLFSIIERNFDILQWYKQITKNDTVPLKAHTLCQLLTNFAEINNDDDQLNHVLESSLMKSKLESDGYFTYENILSFPWFQNTKIIKHKIPLGNRIQMKLNEKVKRIIPLDELFSGNPFDILDQYTLQYERKYKEVVSMDEEFLFHYSHNIENNTIYAVHASELYEEENNYIGQFYFPHLKAQNITTLSQLESNETSLIEKTKTKIQSHNDEFHKTDIFYDVFETSLNTPISYIQKGIESFAFTLESNNYFAKLNIPLESIFQNIHVSQKIPYIQYYSGRKQDPILRLYYEHISSSGKKIPHLSSTILQKIMNKRNGIHPHISLYIHNGLGDLYEDYVELILEKNGNIYFSGKLTKPMDVEEFEPWFISICSDAFNMINEYLRQSGYEIKGFESLWDPYLRINHIDYVCIFTLYKKLQLENHLGCLSSLLYIEPDEKRKREKGEHYRYKRVEYFKVMDDEETYISQLLKNRNFKQDASMIQKMLKLKFPQYSDLEIRKMMQTYAAKYKTVHGRFMNRKVETLAHAGFPIVFQQADFGSTCTVRVSQIDKMPYVNMIPIFLDSLLKLTQYEVPSQYLSLWNQSFDYNKQEQDIETNENENAEMEAKEETPKSLSPYDEKPYNIDEDGDDDDYDDYMDLLGDDDDDDNDEEPINENPQENEKVEEDLEDEKNVNETKEEEEEDEEADFSFSGGIKVKENNPSHYFLNRMNQRAPRLFASMEGYENICPLNHKRQPVILTKKEKEDLDKKYGDNKPYEHELEYGKDDNGDPYYYICPRYWCTKPGEEGALTEEEAKQGKCGKIIKNLKKPKDGEYVYDRTSDLHRAYVPGFVKDNCYPCCFKDWNKAEQQRNRGKCNPDAYDKNEKREQKDNLNFVLDFYQKDGLPTGRVGMIPIPIQQFLNINTSKCIENNKMNNECPVMLRYGVQPTPKNNQSFLSCICELYSDVHEKVPPVSLNEFRNVLCDAIDLDLFLISQNGALVAQFQSKKIKFEGVSIERHTESKLYQKIDKHNTSQMDFLRYSIVSYDNFLDYLRDEEVNIDHMFLMDIVSKPNAKLFPKGLNIVILEEVNHDITNKVRLVCPTNQYTDSLYDKKKDTCLIAKNEIHYDLIAECTRHKDVKRNKVSMEVKKLFSQSDEKSKNLHPIFDNIQFIMEKKCKPYRTTSNLYRFKTNLHVNQIYDLLKTQKLHVNHKVYNYQGKIVALMVRHNKKHMYFPTFPSTTDKLDQVDVKYFDQVKFNDYQNTLAFLKYMFETFEGKIPCKPIYRIEEDGLIVGILTDTNQFIQIDPPIQNVKGDPLPVMKSSNYILADRHLTHPKETDTSSQDETIQYIRLENEFYNAFRTTFRILMALFKNRKAVSKIRNMCLYGDTPLYKRKHAKVVDFLKTLGEGHVSFDNYSKEALMSLNRVYSCQDNASNKQYCIIQEDGGAVRNTLILPSRHLLTKESNEEIYFGRLADELIRHRRVQMFMFYPDQYLNTSSNEYIIQDNEFITLKSLLTPEYLKMEKHKYGKHGEHIPFEHANPSDHTLPLEPINLIEVMEQKNQQ